MRTLSELQQRILKDEYPNLSLDSDSDVERYFELRSNGRQQEALDLYNGRLKRKYPDDSQRTLLMGYYRSRDSRFQEILRESLVTLADRIIVRTTYIINLLTRDIETVNMRDAYSVIKLAEGLLSVISPDRYVAIAFTEKYVRYAKSLDIRHAQMEKTADLIRQYVTDTIESVEELKKEREERRRQHVRRQYQHKNRQPNFDLSQIVFNQADVDRILIPHAITRTEDIVIAYCLKYWNLANDAAFDKTVFLYSRKYKTRHNEIFQAIKNGRMHGWKDEEILNAVLANVVSGYYYNISGDLYLQRAWARAKAGLPQPEGQAQPALMPPVAPVKTSKRKKAAAGRKTRTTTSLKMTKPPVRTVKPVTPFMPHKPSKTEASRIKPVLPQAPMMAPNSIADIIKKLTGKTYTVYKELFFRSVRPSIRSTLASALVKKATLFDGRQNAAEELVYTFLFEHYNDPYQKWKNSAEQGQLLEFGYRLPEIEPIIERWIKDSK